MFRWTLAGLRSLFGRDRIEAELDEELRFHLEMETQANEDQGLPESAARRKALIELGGVEQTRLAVRDIRSNFIDSVLQDLRYGVRHVRRGRGVALPAILTVALAVSLATAVWSVAQAILMRPFPYFQSDRLLAVWKATPEIDFFSLPIPELLDVKDKARSVQDIGGFTREGYVLRAPTGTRWADAFQVTTNLLDVLGLRVVKGRTFQPEDAEPGREKVVVLGESLWRDAFGADPEVVGRHVQMKSEGSKPDDADEFRIVGVVATDLEIFYPNHLRAQMYVPRVLTAEDRSEQARGMPSLISIARLRPGVPVRDGIDDVAGAMRASANEHKAVSFPGATPRVLPLHEELVGRTRPAFLLLAAASGLLLIIGCANVANLVLASGLGRRREFAARMALGCSRARLLRQLLIEHLLLASAGGLLGIVLAAWATPLLRRLAPDALPRAADIRMDATGLAVALALATVAWLASGLAPALAATRGTQLRWDAAGGRTLTSASRRLRNVLLLTQTALVLALLGAAALLTNGMWRLANVDIGFQPASVLAAQITLPHSWWWEADPRTARVERDLIQRLKADSRFVGASVGSELPFTWGILGGVKQHGVEKRLRALVAAVGEDYFPLLGIRLQRGRRFEARDDGNRHIVVINAALQRQLSQRSGLGERLLIGGEWREVVGVVENVTEIGELRGVIRRAGLRRLTLPAAYVPIGSLDCFNHFLLCRTTLDPQAATAVLQKALRVIAPDGMVRRSGWLSERVDLAGADIRFCAVVVGVFAIAALFLGAVGVYSVLAHAVRERTVEIGIRAALGASPREAMWAIARGLIAPVALGGGIGLGMVLLAGRALRSFLFEVPANDPSTLAGAVLIIVGVAALASYLPARAITRLDAARALRAD